MAAGLFEEENANDIFFSRHNTEEALGSASLHPFTLENQEWPTAEHYYQAKIFDKAEIERKILEFKTANDVLAFTKWKWFSKKKGWKQLRQVLMTRAIYTKCKTYPDIAKRLLETGDKKLVENSTYDYYWGCGRDRRAENTYGKVLMNVREKLREEQGARR